MKTELFNKLNILLYYEQHDEARKLIIEAIKSFVEGLTEDNVYSQVKLHCFLIDIGCDCKNEGDLVQGIAFFETNETFLQKHFTKSSYYYNLANAKHGLARIFWSNNPGVHQITTIKEFFHEPIRVYWLAYKNLKDSDTSLLHQILINLSNSLVDCGRLVEGLQYFTSR